MKTLRIGAIVYYVSDIERTEAFYRDTMGLEVQRMDADDKGEPWLLASIPGNVDLVFFKGEVKIGSSPIIVFELAEDIEQVVSNLAEAGVTIVTPVSHAPGGLSADFLDPDCYILSVYQESAE